MSDSAQYESFRAFARSEIAFQVERAKTELKEVLTREAPKVIEGPPGPKGDPGENGKDSTVPGPKGDPGDPGKSGERGADGIATRVELEEIIEDRMADINVRTFADIYKFVYKPGETYARSNVVTWGGSLWLALTDTQSKPGETPDWKLVLKK